MMVKHALNILGANSGVTREQRRTALETIENILELQRANIRYLQVELLRACPLHCAVAPDVTVKIGSDQLPDKHNTAGSTRRFLATFQVTLKCLRGGRPGMWTLTRLDQQ